MYRMTGFWIHNCACNLYRLENCFLPKIWFHSWTRFSPKPAGHRIGTILCEKSGTNLPSMESYP